jgi:PKHD-type hydroxylase|tara:strand:- start:177 stop:749 length:573 start_codon:yes stop_codon:yes gene_type:complete
MHSGLGYWYWNKEISHKNCQKLINLAKGNWSQATTLDNSLDLDNVRKSDVVFVNDQWVYDLIWPFMEVANENAGWKYDIVATQNCQVTKYTKDGFYSWHTDSLGSHNDVHTDPDNKLLFGNTRKLSMSILLNDDYEGGNFEFRGIGEEEECLEGEGSIIVFPSFSWHQVTPVTRGTRYSLVAWFVGPPFV